MPQLPKRMCGVAGCTEFARPGGGYCARHARPTLSDYRRETNSLYRIARWGVMRRKQLEREPLCRACAREHRMTPATEVDHIVPHRGNLSLFYDVNNLQSLCHRCHSAKTAMEVNERSARDAY